MLKFLLAACALAGLALFALGAWRIVASYRFAQESVVRPGTFLGYVKPEGSEDRWLSPSRPSFRVELADGTEREVTGTGFHLFRGLKPGASIDVLVHADPREVPRMRAAGTQYSYPVTLLLAGALVFTITLNGLASAQRWDTRVAGPGDPQIQAPGPGPIPVTRSRGVGLFSMMVLTLVAGGIVGANLFFNRPGPYGRADPASSPPEPQYDPEFTVDAGIQALHDAAREGDHGRLTELLEGDSQIGDLRSSMVTHLIQRDDAASIGLLLDHGLDPSQVYGARSIGDHAVAAGSTGVVALIREHDGSFEAPPQFVALVAEDEAGLRAALQDAAPTEQFSGTRLPYFARSVEKEEFLRSVAPELALTPRQSPRSDHRSAAHAARAGDHVALADFIEHGADIADINPANLISPISQGKVETLRLLFSLDYPYDSYAGSTLGDHAVQHGQKEIVLLVQEYGREFWAAPQFVALVAEDEEALRSALAQAGTGDQFISRSLDYWAEQHGKEALLAAARAPR